MMILLLICCSLLPMAIGLALLVTAPPVQREPTPAELSMSRPVVRPWPVRARVLALRVRRLAVHCWSRPRRLDRAPAVFTAAEVTAAHTIFAGRVADLWSISDSHKPLPCR